MTGAFVMTGPVVQAQLAALIASYGEGVTLNSGGVTRGVRGLFEHPNAQMIATYFDDNEAVALTRPALALLLPGSVTPPAVTDSFARDGRTYTVRKVGLHRLGDTVILYTVIGD